MRILAFDIGGTRGRCGVIQSDGTLLRVEALQRPEADDGPRWLERLLDLGRTVCPDLQDVRAVGISFGGPVGADGRIQSVHVPGWESVRLQQRMLETFQRPLVIENDANAGALGEHRFGAGRGVNFMAFVTVSTGIGGGVILNGKLYRGAHGFAGEFGHMVLHPGPGAPQYATGKPGNLESLACGPAIARALHAAGQTDVTAKDLFDAARRGETNALAIRDAAVDHLGRGLAAILCAYDLERIVVGGGVALAGETLFAPLRQAVAKHLPAFLQGSADVMPAGLGDHSALLGAAAAALDVANIASA